MSDHHRKLERMYLSAPVSKWMGVGVAIREGEADITIPVRPEFFHAAGAVHGSIYFRAMDDAAFFAVNSIVEGHFVLTVSFNVYFLRPIDRGELRATGRVVHASQRLFVAASRLTDSDGRLIGEGSGSFVRSSLTLTPEMGYV